MIFRRYFSVTILMVICFSSSFVSLIEGISTIIDAYKDVEDMYLYGYENSVNMHITSAYEFAADELVGLREQINGGNVFLPDVYIYFDGYENAIYNPSILLVQNEFLPIPTDKEVKMLPDNCVLVPMSYGINDEELKIHGASIKVYAQIDDVEHFSAEMRYTMNAATYFACYQDGFDGHDFSIRVASNEVDPYEYAVEIEGILRGISEHFQVEYSEENYDRNVFSYANDDSILVSNLLYFFAVINSMIVTFYWVMVRKKEISIRKAFGATNSQIWRRMFGELLTIIGAIGVVIYFVGGIYHIITMGWASLQDYFYVGIGFTGLIILATLLSLFIPLKKIIDTEPKEGVSD